MNQQYIKEQYLQHRKNGYSTKRSLGAAKLQDRLKTLEKETGFRPVMEMFGEEINPSDNLSFENTGVDFSNQIEEIHERLDNGDQSAWFSACVHFVNDRGLQVGSEDWLGCCSYNSEKEFTEKYFPDYYMDMIMSCLNDLFEQAHMGGFTQKEVFAIMDCRGRGYY
jgi:hypothetical protein